MSVYTCLQYMHTYIQYMVTCILMYSLQLHAYLCTIYAIYDDTHTYAQYMVTSILMYSIWLHPYLCTVYVYIHTYIQYMRRCIHAFIHACKKLYVFVHADTLTCITQGSQIPGSGLLRGPKGRQPHGGGGGTLKEWTTPRNQIPWGSLLQGVLSKR